MKKVVLNVDEGGSVSTDSGYYVGLVPSTEKVAEAKSSVSIAELNSMKMAGWDVGAIITMKKEGLL